MSPSPSLPSGQRQITSFPRFGLSRFAHRFPNEIQTVSLRVGGDLESFDLSASSLASLNRVSQTSDFHCVTTWSACGLEWSGFRFSDFYHHCILPHLSDAQVVTYVVLQGQDGYRTGMYLKDLLASDVLLADTLNGQSLPVAHGAPLRLVAPAHYGYKCVKHIKRIDFWEKERPYRRAAFTFMDHPRARVAREERGLIFPGWLLRTLYRPLVAGTIRRFEKALDNFEGERN